MSSKTDFLSWDDADIPWDIILEDEDDFLAEDVDIDSTAINQPSADCNKENYRKPAKKAKRCDEQLSCSQCSKVYKTVAGFRRHVANVHGDSTTIASQQDDQTQEIRCLVSSAFIPALMSIISSPFRNGTSAFGQEVITVAETVKESTVETASHLMTFLEDEFSRIFQCDRYLDLSGSTQRERLCSAYGMLISNRQKMASLRQAVKLCFKEHSVTEAALKRFSVCFCRQMLETVTAQLTSSKSGQSSKASREISDTDQSVLFYIAGYILYSLKHQFSRRKSANNLKQALDAILGLNSKCGRTFLLKYKAWTEKLSRGGLILPCDDFFLLIRELEIICRETVQMDSLSADALNKLSLTKTILDSFMVHYYWGRLCTIASCDKDLLLERIIRKFLTVRGYAVAKFLKTKSTSGEKSLRKTLKLKSGKENIL